MPAITYTAKIYQEITKLFEKLDSKAINSNIEKLIARAHFWDCIQSYAKKQSDAAWKALETEEVISNPKSLTQGKHILAESSHFIVQANVSAPYKTFKPDVLAESLNKKYRVPKPICIEMIEQSKIPGNPRCTLETIER